MGRFDHLSLGIGIGKRPSFVRYVNEFHGRHPSFETVNERLKVCGHASCEMPCLSLSSMCMWDEARPRVAAVNEHHFANAEMTEEHVPLFPRSDIDTEMV